MSNNLVFTVVLTALLFTGCAKVDPNLKAGVVRQITAPAMFVPLQSTVQEVGQVAQLNDLSSKFPEGKDTVVHSSAPLDLALIEQQIVTIPVVEEPSPSAEYVVGVNDVLYINVSGKPEFSSSSAVSLSSSRNVTGNRVDGKGDIQFPYVGTIHVAGLTLTEIQERLTEILQAYIKSPWVMVEVVEYKSQPVYLLGEFRDSGTYYMDRPLNLLQGIALGKGFDNNTANLSSARLIRDGKIAPVDLYELLTKGNYKQNIWLKSGDTIFIPDNKNMQVFIFGSVKKPGPISVSHAGLTLVQALASAEIRDTGYDIGNVRIIRSLSATRGELLVVDIKKMLKGEVLPLSLKDGDVIYVPKSNIGNWNDAIAEILPSLQVFSATLQPFVNIKYLSK